MSAKRPPHAVAGSGRSRVWVGIALMLTTGCAPLTFTIPAAAERPLSHVPRGCVHRNGLAHTCYGCVPTAWGDDTYCDRLFIGSIVEWRL